MEVLSPMVEMEIRVLLGTLSISPSCVNTALEPGLFLSVFPVTSGDSAQTAALGKTEEGIWLLEACLREGNPAGPCWAVPSAQSLALQYSLGPVLCISLLHLHVCFGISTASY